MTRVFEDWHDYQKVAIRGWWQSLCDHPQGDPLIAMPTGTGKSFVIAGFVHSMLVNAPNARIMVVTHVEKLIKQNMKALRTVWPQAPMGCYSAGLDLREHWCPVTFAGVASAVKNPDLFGRIDVFIVDEAHLVSPDAETMYRKLIAALRVRNPNMRVCGLSATCYRTGLGPLTDGGMFSHIAVDMTTMEWFEWFVMNGYLCPLVAKRTDLQFDTSNIKTSGNDYNQKDLQALMDQDSKTRRALAEVVAKSADRKSWLIFAAGIHHADRIVDILETEFGISAVAVHSESEDAAGNLERFERGEVRCAVSMNSLTTGVDVPGIDLIVILRPTKSTSLWVQMLGRGTRVASWLGKLFCLVLDFTSNSQRLGAINDPVLPRRRGERVGKAKQGAPVRLCPNPYCATWVHASKSECPQCGHIFERSVQLNGESAAIDVMKLQKKEEDVVEILPITRVTYHKNTSRNSEKPPTLRVTYYVDNGFRIFKDFICFEHPDGNFARSKAIGWWASHYDTNYREHVPPAPRTIDEAMKSLHLLRKPVALRVHTNAKPYPEILGYAY